jgi:NAD(P)H dehydrogenase (quinone)
MQETLVLPKVLVLYYSRTGNTEKMTRAVAEGVEAVQGVDVELSYFVASEMLSQFDALVAGTPAYHHEITRRERAFSRSSREERQHEG